MSLPTTPAAYNDCYEIWTAATTLRGGCRSLVGPDFAKAVYLRMRMHQARQILRNINRRAYPTENPLWNTSEFDAFKVSIKEDSDGNHWLYVEPHGNWAAVDSIEAIPDEELGILPEDIAAKNLSAITYHPQPLLGAPDADVSNDLD